MEIDVDASAHAEDHTDDNIMDVTHPTSLGEGLPTQISPSSSSEEDVVNSGNGQDRDSPMDACERNESACGIPLGAKEINVKSKDKSESISDSDNGEPMATS